MRLVQPRNKIKPTESVQANVRMLNPQEMGPIRSYQYIKYQYQPLPYIEDIPPTPFRKLSRTKAHPKLPRVLSNVFFNKPQRTQPQKTQLLKLSDLVSNSSGVQDQCQVCLNSYPLKQMASISVCGHYFCTPCLNKYIIFKINSMQEVNCIGQECAHTINTRGIIYQPLTPYLKKNYERNAWWLMTAKNSNLILCPTQTCQGIIDKNHPGMQYPQCKMKSCPTCQLPEHTGPCDVNFNKFLTTMFDVLNVAFLSKGSMVADCNSEFNVYRIGMIVIIAVLDSIKTTEQSIISKDSTY